MLKKCVLTMAVMAVALLGTANQAQAVIAWDWDFTNNNPTVGSSDVVYLNGRLTNNSTAGETIGSFDSGSTAYVSSGSAAAVAGYGFDFGPIIDFSGSDFFAQFDTAINPGNFIDFTFGAYSPTGVTPFGTYTALPQIIGLSLKSDQSSLGAITRCYSWNVSDTGAPGADGCNPNGGTNPNVPEPTSLLLIGSGLVGAFVQRKKII